MIGLFIFVLRLVNLKLAYHKGQYDRSVDWIGTTLQFGGNGIIATIKQEKRSELQKLIASTLKKERGFFQVSAFLGREVVQRGPPLDHMEAIFTRPVGCVGRWHVAGCAQSAHLDEANSTRFVVVPGISELAHLPLSGPFSFDAYPKSASSIVITTDASPFGFGGVLQINGLICSCVAVEITAEDGQIFQVLRGSPD